MKKILFGITGLTLGGAERVLVDIANNLCHEYDITIFTIYAGGELEEALDKRIKRKSLYHKSYQELTNLQKKYIPIKILLLQNYLYHKKIKGDYEVEISFLEGPITRLFSVKNDRTKKIAWIHNDITKVFGSGIKAWIKKCRDTKLYDKFETLVFVSKDNLGKFKKAYKTKANMQVIYNYIDTKNVKEKANEVVEALKVPNLVTVARLVEQKAMDRFVEVHSKLIKEGYKHNVYVIGDGPEKEKIQAKIKENQVEETFLLLGKKTNPYPYINQATYFCLFSKFEGYGMVLEEAKILGRPILITDTAAREACQRI